MSAELADSMVGQAGHDALRPAARAAHADVPVTARAFPGAPHVFQGFAPAVEEAAQALDQVADFINSHAQQEG
ncbi:hypothetical protein [Streptomyces tsukubensis]|uniref:Alpha/beta hydrolase fold-3 domain-containing protein n=1 Tax=Streptomyces tsukubensis TaxID=83656 RepID=A0A1V4AEK0_9ACTN|nr:hypothetical protein [Streptomyces tsukubensis]OON82524.1 hypothetical protein B1H18_00010 [Streptomyces tsukubensis]